MVDWKRARLKTCPKIFLRCDENQHIVAANMMNFHTREILSLGDACEEYFLLFVKFEIENFTDDYRWKGAF